MLSALFVRQGDTLKRADCCARRYQQIKRCSANPRLAGFPIAASAKDEIARQDLDLDHHWRRNFYWFFGAIVFTGIGLIFGQDVLAL